MQLTQQTEMPWEQLFADRTGGIRPSEIREFLKLLGEPGIISFAGGIPDPDLFPVEAIDFAVSSIMIDPAMRTQALQYATSEGYALLREWIAGYMTAKGAPCDVENILITTGSQQALDLIAKVLLDPGDTILTAAPTYLGALQAFNLYQPRYESVESDDLRNRASWMGAKLAYFVPDFGNPSGETLGVPERRRILEYATLTTTPVIEDAAYEALRFDGDPEPSLLALDIEERGSIDRSAVIYTGTFSKTIAPGLRVGWICAARPVIQKIVLARQAADLHGSTLDQMIVYQVAASGFAEQVARLILVYRRRRDVMLDTLANSMPAGTRWTTPQGGMFVWLTLPAGIDSRDLLRESLEAEKIIFVPGPSFFADSSGAEHIRLNFTRSDESTIVEGIQRLARLVTRKVESVVPESGARSWSS
jgi:DNA-binding transcriptional MocR family regulator